jgi:hypothetical protein
MASIRERIETVFSALAFAERDLTQEARDLLGEAQEERKATANTVNRADSRPRIRA